MDTVQTYRSWPLAVRHWLLAGSGGRRVWRQRRSPCAYSAPRRVWCATSPCPYASRAVLRDLRGLPFPLLSVPSRPTKRNGTAWNVFAVHSHPDGSGETLRNGAKHCCRISSAETSPALAQRGATGRNLFATPGLITGHAAQSHRMQHSRIDFTDEPTSDAAQSHTMQQTKLSSPRASRSDAAGCKDPHHATHEFPERPGCHHASPPSSPCVLLFKTSGSPRISARLRDLLFPSEIPNLKSSPARHRRLASYNGRFPVK